MQAGIISISSNVTINQCFAYKKKRNFRNISSSIENNKYNCIWCYWYKIDVGQTLSWIRERPVSNDYYWVSLYFSWVNLSTPVNPWLLGRRATTWWKPAWSSQTQRETPGGENRTRPTPSRHHLMQCWCSGAASQKQIVSGLIPARLFLGRSITRRPARQSTRGKSDYKVKESLQF